MAVREHDFGTDHALALRFNGPLPRPALQPGGLIGDLAARTRHNLALRRRRSAAPQQDEFLQSLCRDLAYYRNQDLR